MTKLVKCYLIPLIITFLTFKINSQCVNGGGSPIDVTDCTKNNNESNYCCMLSSPGYNPSTRMCMNIPKNSFVGQNTYNYNNLSWRLNCGNAPVTIIKGAACGNSLPLRPADCWLFSQIDSSCCFYLSNNSTGTPGCEWLGSKKMGQTLNNNNILLNCNENFLSGSNLILLVISFVLVLFL